MNPFFLNFFHIFFHLFLHSGSGLRRAVPFLHQAVFPHTHPAIKKGQLEIPGKAELPLFRHQIEGFVGSFLWSPGKNPAPDLKKKPALFFAGINFFLINQWKLILILIDSPDENVRIRPAVLIAGDFFLIIENRNLGGH